MKRKILLAVLLGILLLALTGCACKHEETELINAVEATCTQQGYTGDTFCVKCEKVISEGEPIEMLPHTEGEPTGVKEVSCTEDGYTGDVHCTVCGELLKQGEAIPATGHVETELTDAYAASCTMEGYSGDERCKACGAIVTMGEVIPMLAHTPGEPVDACEPSCSKEGYTGDVYCTVCGEILEWGEVIPLLEHTLMEPRNVVEATCLSEGYTGDRECSVCHEIVEGEAIPRKEHDYVDNVCTVCGWRVPGLYIENELALSWDQLLESGYVTAEGNELISVADSLMGTLVVDESITVLRGGEEKSVLGNSSPFAGMSEIECIYLPCEITSLGDFGNGTFSGCTKLKEIRAFGTLKDLGRKETFMNCTALEEFDIPEGITVIGKSAFAGCTSLSRVTIPSTVEEIGDGAFDGTPSLTSIELPEGLKSLGDTFRESGVTSIVFPSTLTDISCTWVPYIDASKCSWEEVGRLAFYQSHLKGIKLPASVKSLDYCAFAGCAELEALILPDGFTSIHELALDYCPSITTIVWPTSLLDGSSLSEHCRNLTTIYYRGSELQWNLTVSKAEFEGVNVIFDYAGDGSELQHWPS